MCVSFEQVVVGIVPMKTHLYRNVHGSGICPGENWQLECLMGADHPRLWKNQAVIKENTVALLCQHILKNLYKTNKQTNYMDGPSLQRFDIWVFDFTMVWQQYAFNRNRTSRFDIFPGWWHADRLILLGCCVITRANHQYSPVCCVASIFWIACFVFLHPIISTNACLCLLLLGRRGRQLLSRCNSRSLPNCGLMSVSWARLRSVRLSCEVR